MAPQAPAGAAFRLDIGRPIAGNDPKVKNIKSAVLVVGRLAASEPASARISGTAEGVVNGVRRSIPLKLTPLEKPGVHAVNQEWPDGRWVLSLVGTCRDQTAGALVPLARTGFLRESSRFLAHAATAPEIEASLNALRVRLVGVTPIHYVGKPWWKWRRASRAAMRPAGKARRPRDLCHI